MCSQKCANPGISTGSEHAPTCTFIATADVVESGSEHSNTFNPLGNVYVLYARLSNGGLIILIGLVDSELSAINDDAVFDTVDGVSSSISAFAANGAKVVDARRDSTRRRRVVLSASLNSTVLNFSLYLSLLSMSLLESSEDDDVVVMSTLHNFLLALLILQKLLVDVDGKNPTAVGSVLSNTSAPNQLQLYHQLWTIIDATRVYTLCRLPLLQSTGLARQN